MANDTTLDKVVIEFDGKVNKFDASIDTLIEEIKGLREQLKGMGKDAKDAGDDFKKSTEDVDKMSKSAKGLSLSLSSVKKTYAVFTGMTKSIMKFTEMSTQAIGVQTRFNSVFGSTKEELKDAKTWVNEYSDALYLDNAEVMDAASTFKLLAGNIGLTNEQANIMSEGLTKLSYDLMALRGENDASMAQTALQSALGGEAEAMKRYGVMLNQATLQQTLYSLGIDRTVASLNAAERAQLIYYQIMNTTAGQQGYYAKTLMSPANALKIIKTQFTLLAREIGNVFIPILMELLPVVIAITKVLRELAQWLAGIFNIDINFDNITSGVGDITTGIGGIGEEADKTSGKIKNMTRDFDKLHVVNFDTGSGSGESGGVGMGSGFGDAIDLTPYKEWNTELDKSKEKVEKIKKWLYEAKDWILAIVGALSAYKVSKSILDFFDAAKIFTSKGSIIQSALGIALTLGSLILLKDGIEHLVKGEWTAENIMQTAFGIMGLTAGIMNTVKGFTGTSLGLGKALLISIGVSLAIAGIEKFKEGIQTNNARDKVSGILQTALGVGLAAWTLAPPGTKFIAAATAIIGTTLVMSIIDIITTPYEGNDWEKNLRKQQEKTQELINNPTSEESRQIVQERLKLQEQSGNTVSFPKEYKEALETQMKEDGITNENLLTIWQTQGYDAMKQAQAEYSQARSEYIEGLKTDPFDKHVSKTFSDLGISIEQFEGKYNKNIISLVLGNKSFEKSTKETTTSTKTMAQGVTSEYKSMQVVGTESITSLKTSVIQNAKLLEQGGVSSVRKFVNDSISNMKQMKTNGTGDMTTLTSNTIATLKELQRSGNPEVAEFATASLNEIKNMTSMVKKDTDDMQKTTVNKFSDLTKKITSTFDDANPTISKSIDKIKGLMNFDWQLPKIKLPKFSWTTTPIDKTSWAGKILSALNMPMSIPKLNLDWFAGGGFPDTGSLFVANEREPELIGSWGNKSMVANSTQIIKGIESASYNGMKRALTEVPMSNETNVYVGNKQLTDVVTKQQRRNNNKYGR